MIAPICPDCFGSLTAGLLYGLTPSPITCLICWECGYQVPAVYQRTRRERNWHAGKAVAACRDCGAEISARVGHLLRAYCDDCYSLRRQPPLSAAAVQGPVRRVS